MRRVVLLEVGVEGWGGMGWDSIGRERDGLKYGQ